MKTILMKRKAGRYADEMGEGCDFEFNNLKQVEKYILNENEK